MKVFLILLGAINILWIALGIFSALRISGRESRKEDKYL